MAWLWIGEREYPAPSQVERQSVVIGAKETRAASGRLLIDLVTRKKRLTLRWNGLTNAALTALIEATDAETFAARTGEETGTYCRTECSELRTLAERADSLEMVWEEV